MFPGIGLRIAPEKKSIDARLADGHVCGASRVLRTPENRRSDRLQAVSSKFSSSRDESVVLRWPKRGHQKHRSERNQRGRGARRIAIAHRMVSPPRPTERLLDTRTSTETV